MIERELGRGWVLQTWSGHEAAPRLCCRGTVVALDVDGDLVVEMPVPRLGAVVPLTAVHALVAATDAHRAATAGLAERRP